MRPSSIAAGPKFKGGGIYIYRFELHIFKMGASKDAISALLPLHEWAALKSELVWIYDRELQPQMRHWKGPGDGMPGYRLWLIRRGSVVIKRRARTYEAAAGEWISPVNQAREVNFSEDAHILSIHFLCQWPSGESILRDVEGRKLASAAHPELEKLAVRLLRQLRRQFPANEPGAHVYSRRASSCTDFLECQSLFLRWLSAWIQAEVEAGASLTRLAGGEDRPFLAARFLNQAPLGEGFPDGALQRETGLGMMRLNQLFLAEFGVTTRKYWDRRRLETARQCLETSPMAMKEISCLLGFRSDSHFVVWFRRLAGQRPGDYRKNYRKTSLP
jgi:AraC-like DNA-binding protein